MNLIALLVSRGTTAALKNALSFVSTSLNSDITKVPELPTGFDYSGKLFRAGIELVVMNNNVAKQYSDTVVQKGRSADRNRMSKSTLDKGVPGRLNPIVCPIHKIVLEHLVAGGTVLPPSPDGSVFINDIKVLRLSHMWQSQAVLVTMVVEGLALSQDRRPYATGGGFDFGADALADGRNAPVLYYSVT